MAGFLVCVPLHFLWKLIGPRTPWPRRFLWWAGWCAGLRVRVEGRPLRDHVLFVANHVTWLDIFVLGGATCAVFVARDDIEGWPLVGWAAGLNDTIYVARHARREVHGQADQLRRALEAGRAVALFPEGTTANGRELLPFRPSLFACLFPAIDRVQVQPVAIDYGPLAPEIAWVGDEPTGDNAKRVVGRRGTIPVTLRFLAPVDPHVAGDRKTLAGGARDEVIEALGLGGNSVGTTSGPDPHSLYARR